MENRVRMLSYEEFEGFLDDVSEKLGKFLNESSLKVDYVVPIMRSGLVPATYIANKFNIIKFAPFQVKYVSRSGAESQVEMLFNPINEMKLNKPEPVFLVVDGTHSTGTSARLCIGELLKSFPKAKILYVCLIKEYGSDSFENLVDFECHAHIIGEYLSVEEREKLGTDPDFLYYPWENPVIEETHIDDDADNIYF